MEIEEFVPLKESFVVNATETLLLALVPHVCSELPRNKEQPGAAYSSLALQTL